MSLLQFNQHTDTKKAKFCESAYGSQLLDNSRTCPRAFNEVVELSEGVSSPLAINTHTNLHLSAFLYDKNNIQNVLK